MLLTRLYKLPITFDRTAHQRVHIIMKLSDSFLSNKNTRLSAPVNFEIDPMNNRLFFCFKSLLDDRNNEVAVNRRFAAS